MELDIRSTDSFVKDSMVAKVVTSALRYCDKTQATVAEEIGISANVLTMWKQARTPVSILRASDFAKATGIDPVEFMELVADESYPEFMNAMSEYFELVKK